MSFISPTLSRGTSSTRVEEYPENFSILLQPAIKSNNVKLVECLLNQPSRPRHISIRDVFFYMECLSEHEAPNLEILRLLLDHVLDINEKVISTETSTSLNVLSLVWTFVPDVDNFNFSRDIPRNLLDHAIYQMSCFQRLHIDVIEELFKRGVRVSEENEFKPFRLLKKGQGLNLGEPFLEIFTASRQWNAQKLGSMFFPIMRTLKVCDNLSLNHCCNYLKLEKKYDPQPSSFLSLKAFSHRIWSLRNSFECVRVCSRFLRSEESPNPSLDSWTFLKVYPSVKEVCGEESEVSFKVHKEDGFIESKVSFGLNFSSDDEESIELSSPEECGELMLLDTEDQWRRGLLISLRLFHDRVIKHAQLLDVLDVLIKEGSDGCWSKIRHIKDCLSGREIRDITDTLNEIACNFGVDKAGDSDHREEILSICTSVWKKLGAELVTTQVFEDNVPTRNGLKLHS